MLMSSLNVTLDNLGDGVPINRNIIILKSLRIVHSWLIVMCKISSEAVSEHA